MRRAGIDCVEDLNYGLAVMRMEGRLGLGQDALFRGKGKLRDHYVTSKGTILVRSIV
jgi:hypothetical protein